MADICGSEAHSITVTLTACE
ncbi:MAG: hypothetical protein C207_06871, partial [Bradyrhizobium sp. DFCI-1]